MAKVNIFSLFIKCIVKFGTTLIFINMFILKIKKINKYYSPWHILSQNILTIFNKMTFTRTRRFTLCTQWDHIPSSTFYCLQPNKCSSLKKKLYKNKLELLLVFYCENNILIKNRLKIHLLISWGVEPPWSLLKCLYLKEFKHTFR